MKFYITALLVLFCFGVTKAQHLDKSLIATSGYYNLEGEVKLHFAIGEPAISSYNNSIILTEGFFQDSGIMISSLGSGGISIETNMYPNPADDMVFVEINSNENLDLMMYNSLGIPVLKPESFEGLCKFEIATLPVGQYFIIISNQLGNSNIHKFIKI